MFAALAKSIFGSANDRYVRSLGKYVDAVNGFEPTISALTDDELRGQTELFRERLAEWREARRPASRGLRDGPRSGDPDARPAPLRRPADRRHRAPPRRDRRDEDRRGQDAGRDARGLSQRARGQGRPRRHRQRLSRPPRRRLDGADLPLPRHDGRGDRAQPDRPGAARRLQLRHHLRDQQRARLRLPARQHEIFARRRWSSGRSISRSSTRWTRS